jgi:hypothetical protein
MTAVIYGASASWDFDEGDGLGEITLAQGGWTFRSYHLFHTALNKLVLLGLATLGLRVDATAAIHALNIGLGAVTVSLVFLVLALLGVRRTSAAFAAAVFALSQAPWFHSVTGETGITPMPFVLAAFMLVMPINRPGLWACYGRALAAAALLSASVWLSLNLVVLLPALAILIWRLGMMGGPGSVSLSLVTLVGLLVFGCGPFVMVSLAEGRASVGEFAHWLFYKPDTELLGELLGGFMRVPRTLVGIGRLLFPMSDGETWLKALLQSRSVQHELSDYVTLARNLAGALILVGLATVGAWRRWSETAGWVIAAAVVVTAVFCLLWLGSDPQFWLPAYPFLLAGAAFGVGAFGERRRARRVRTWLALAVCAILFMSNYAMLAPSLLSPHGSPEWIEVSRAAAVMSPGDVIIGPGASHFTSIAMHHKGVQYVTVVYQFPHSLRGEAFLARVGQLIESRLAENRHVFVHGLGDPIPVHLLGNWDMLTAQHGVSQWEVRTAIDRQFVRRARPDIGKDIDELTRPQN